MFHPLLVHNNKYFSPKIWEMFKDMKTEDNKLFFFFENKKKLNFCFIHLIILFIF